MLIICVWITNNFKKSSHNIKVEIWESLELCASFLIYISTNYMDGINLNKNISII